MTLHLAVSGKPVFDEKHRFCGYRGTATDETAVREAQHRAEQAEALLRDAVDSISEGFVIYDEEDRLFICNETYRRYPESAELMVPDILKVGVANGQYADAAGREEEWLAERMRQHRELKGSIEVRLRDGRCVLVTERRMRNGWTAGRCSCSVCGARLGTPKHLPRSSILALCWCSPSIILSLLLIVMTWHVPSWGRFVPSWLAHAMYPIDKTNLDPLHLAFFVFLASRE